MHNRFYGTENGNTELYNTVNESKCGDTLTLANAYRFHVEIGDIDKRRLKRSVRYSVPGT